MGSFFLSLSFFFRFRFVSFIHIPLYCFFRFRLESFFLNFGSFGRSLGEYFLFGFVFIFVLRFAFFVSFSLLTPLYSFFRSLLGSFKFFFLGLRHWNRVGLCFLFHFCLHFLYFSNLPFIFFSLGPSWAFPPGSGKSLFCFVFRFVFVFHTSLTLPFFIFFL